MANLIIVCLTAIALYGMKLYAQRGGKAAPAAPAAAPAAHVNLTVHVQGDNNGIAGEVAAGATVNIHIAQAAAAR